MSAHGDWRDSTRRKSSRPSAPDTTWLTTTTTTNHLFMHSATRAAPPARAHSLQYTRSNFLTRTPLLPLPRCSPCPAAQDSLVAAGGVPRLVGLLQHPDPAVSGCGLAALSRLADHSLAVEAIR